MFNKLNFTTTLILSSLASIMVHKVSLAQTSLELANIEFIQNQVRLIPNGQDARNARLDDLLNLGDAIATGNASSTDLRFNDLSLARLGEQAIFRFLPGTRTIDLVNGTGLFLINPGQGTTTIRTPNAAAGIRGSALFVRVIPAVDNAQEVTTLIGALTDSGIQACNQDASQCVELDAGVMAFFEGIELAGVFQFNLETFINTSSLAKDMDEVAPDLVLNEVQEALINQPVLDGTILNTPDFVKMPDNNINNNTEFPNTDIAVIDFDFDSIPLDNEVLENVISLNMDIQDIAEVAEIQMDILPTNDIIEEVVTPISVSEMMPVDVTNMIPVDNIDEMMPIDNIDEMIPIDDIDEMIPMDNSNRRFYWRGRWWRRFRRYFSNDE